MANDVSQNSKKRNKVKGKRGFMAIYHDIEEICYGPECGMPEVARVLFCIRHKLLRDGLCEKGITFKFISEKTGLLKRNIIPCIKELEKKGIIIVTKHKKEVSPGKFQYLENTYSLNPQKFGNIYNWYKHNPTVRVYSKNRERSYSRKGLPSNESVDSLLIEHEGPGVVSGQRPGVVSDKRPQDSLKLTELMGILASKNPYSNNPKKKNPSSEDLKFSKKGKSRTQAEHEAIVKQQLKEMKQ